MSDSEKALFTHHEHALEKPHEVCPECAGDITIKYGKSGPFLGCSHYPSCQYTRPIVEHERVENNILAGTECPICSSNLAVKQGRYGMFIGCTNYPECQHIEETHHQGDVNVACPKCQQKDNGELFEKTNRYGKTFYSCNNYPKCKFVINHEPVDGFCEKCQFPLLLKRNMAAGIKYQCASKKCSYMQKSC